MLKRVTRIHLAVAAVHWPAPANRRDDLARYFRQKRAYHGGAEFRRSYRTMYGPLLPLEG